MNRCVGLLLVILSSLEWRVQAEVVLDGTLGPARNLEGPDFKITADLGRLEGGNLFHSFSQFNFIKDESVTFQGPDSVQNIISRITGGEKSVIDGKLRSEIPHANLYLLNPEGFVFGPNATLGVAGSLHISTASALQFEDGGQFTSRVSEPAVLVSAPPVAFGFLDAKPAAIEIKETHLVVPDGKTLSLSAGQVRIDDGELRAVSGRINLIGVERTNELKITSPNPTLGAHTQLGKVTLKNNSSIDVGKQGAGEVFIRGGQFVLENSEIVGHAFNEQDGGTIAIEAEDLRLTASKIDTRTFGSAHGGKIVMKVTGTIELENGEVFTTSRESEAKSGNAGDITLIARNLKLTNSSINTETTGNGHGGAITIDMSMDINLISLGDEVETAIQARSARQEEGGGDAGRITINTRNLTLNGPRSRIDNSTLGTGHGGSITLDAADSLRIVDGALISADSKGIGNAGSITINTNSLAMDKGGISTAANQADGGNIVINVHNQLNMQNSQISATVSGGAGDGGNLIIGSPQVFRLKNSAVSANANDGNGGAILIISGSPVKSDNSKITASSEHGVDGNVKVDVFSVNLIALPKIFLDASFLIKKSCAGRSTEDKVSTLILVGKKGLPNAPDDLQIYIPYRCSRTTKKPAKYL